VIALRSLGFQDPVSISFELPLYVACSELSEEDLMSGQGADELFGGYSRYSTMDALSRRKAMDTDIEGLLSSGAEREGDLARRFGKRLVCPYLSPEVISISKEFAPDEMIGPEGNKLPLRYLASSLGLPSASSPKKAAQYGSGTMAAMKRMASRDKLPIGRWVAEVKG